MLIFISMGMVKKSVTLAQLLVTHGPKKALREMITRALNKALNWTELNRSFQDLSTSFEQKNAVIEHQFRVVDDRHRSVEKTLDLHLPQYADSLRQLVGKVVEAFQDSQGVMPQTKVSVIMPVFNRVALISPSIRSVLEQKNVKFELILIDDESSEILNVKSVPELAHPLVKFIKIKRGGSGAARNQGLAESSGEVIVYLDSDNLMYPGYLNAIANAYEASPEINCGYAAQFWDNGKTLVSFKRDAFSWPDLFSQKINLDMNCFSHRRKVWQELGGFDESLLRHGDYDLILRYTLMHRPVRITAVSAHYYSGDLIPRITNLEPSEPAMKHIYQKYLDSKIPLKVLVYCATYPQLSESYIETEIEWLVRQGIDVVVFSASASTSPGVAKVPVYHSDLEKVIQKFNPQVIHCHWLHTSDDVVEIAGRLGIPVTVRSHAFDFAPETISKVIGYSAVKSVYLYPHFAASLTGSFPQVKSVRACFNPKRFFPLQERNKKWVLRAGAALFTKDLELFVRVASRCPDFKFILALAETSGAPTASEAFMEFNRSFGNPVEIRLNVQYDEMADLVRQAGIYLHTFGFLQPFGMPVSIIESMACGSAVLVRDCVESREYAGAGAFYYQTEDEAVALIQDTQCWTDTQWDEVSDKAVTHAYSGYTDDQVLKDILGDWRGLVTRHKIGELKG